MSPPEGCSPGGAPRRAGRRVRPPASSRCDRRRGQADVGRPRWRGLGLATRLLQALEEQARRPGYREVYLDTHESLVEAHAMYRALRLPRHRALQRQPVRPPLVRQDPVSPVLRVLMCPPPIPSPRAGGPGRGSGWPGRSPSSCGRSPGSLSTRSMTRCRSELERATTRAHRSPAPVIVCASSTSGMVARCARDGVVPAVLGAVLPDLQGQERRHREAERLGRELRSPAR